jgi:hypothetical protein
MIRQLTQCPYCQGCEVALTDSPEVVFNPGSPPSSPCPHLIWVEGRYSQWELSPLPDRKTRIPRMIGSTEFEWQHPSLAAREDVQELRAFLKDLVGAEPNWEFAPSEAHAVRPITRDGTIMQDGKVYPQWEVEGAAVFAQDAAAFVERLPACMASRSAGWQSASGGFPALQ